MTDAAALEIFTGMIARSTRADEIARIELIREFALNPTFRANLQEFTWEINQAKGA